ncbi:MAG TPA: DUF2085 domain-containing protein [Acidobacteriaceae bacterium]|nr:DUF2085 domain-containing protein [Acidobacteriaceae bacterium]
MRSRLPLAILVLALISAPLAAPLLAATHPVMALLIRDFFSRLCHQDPSRSFVVDGSPVAVCVRCLGIYWGVAAGMVLRMKRARSLLAMAMLLNVLDVASSALHLHGNLPLTRFLLGLLLGVGVGALLFSAQGPARVRLFPKGDTSN